MRPLRMAECGLRNGAATAFIVVLAVGLLMVPLRSDAEQPGKVYRIGWLGVNPPAATDITSQHCPIKGNPNWQAWVEGLREHGYVPGQNVVIECRYTEAREERAPAYAAELVSLKPDLLVVFSTANVRAAKQATSTLPIVMVGVTDPVRRGLVPSLVHPGGNVTGLADTFMEMEGKRLQLLKEAVPTVTHVAVLSYSSGPPSPTTDPFRREVEAAARALGVTLQFHYVRSPEELDGAFTALTKAGAEALFLVPHPFWFDHRQRIINLAAQHRLPAMYPHRELFPVGGLLVYDVDRPAIFRRLGLYVDKIFKGANPGDLPVEQPTKLDLLINLKTAKALGLTIPQSLLMRADEVIQ